MKTFRRAEVVAAAVCAAAGLSPSPVDAGGAVTTSTFLPLQVANLSIPGGTCPSDLITLSGMLHVLTILTPSPPPIKQGVPSPPPIKLHFNMAGVMGTGSSGNTYVATGAQEVVIPSPPPIDQGFTLITTPSPPPIDQGITAVPSGPPIAPPSFQLEGTGDCAGQAQLPLFFKLSFDATGHLLGLPGSTVSLVPVQGSCTESVCPGE